MVRSNTIHLTTNFMKRIEFIAPVEAIRGNMSGRQDLKYAENDNPAYESPRGQRNYARNYRPSFIGAKVSASGIKYFAVKTKTAGHTTAKAIKAMALQGATGALVGSLLAHKSAQPYITMQALYIAKKTTDGLKVSFRKFASDLFRQGLIEQVENFVASSGSVSVSIKNPWNNGSMTTGAEVAKDVLAKFWDQLHGGGITFAVNGAKGIGDSGDSFDVIINDAGLNILGLSTAEVGSTVYVKRSTGWLLYNGIYVENDEIPVNGRNYTTTSVAPEG